MWEQSIFFGMKSNSLSIRAQYQPTKDIGSRKALDEHLFVARGRATHDVHGVPPGSAIASLAAESTGGAVTLTLSSLPMGPPISLREARS